MKLATVCMVLALAWTGAVHAQPSTTAIYPVNLNAKAVMQSASTPLRDGVAARSRALTDADIVRSAGFDVRTHALAVAGNSHSLELFIWDRRQPRTAPGALGPKVGTLVLSNPLPVSPTGQPRVLRLVTAALTLEASAGNGSLALTSTGVARLASDAEDHNVLLTPVDGDTASHGTLQQCRLAGCVKGYLTTVNIEIGFRRSIGFLELPPSDTDGDGYTDDVDACPNQADEGYGVDTNGCPLTGSEDSDGDGVPDLNDSCPADGNAGYGVDANGCPNVDSDGDGVFDADDACPDRGEEGYGVDFQGCPNPPTPQDFDGDGVTDDVDQCFSEGDTYGYGVYPNGCPIMDSDGDTYADPFDACPELGDQGNGVDGTGCPNPP